MSIAKKIRVTFAIFAVIWLAACQGVPIHLNTSDVVSRNTNSPPITAQACGFQLLLVIPINANTRQMRAWTLLQGQANGRGLTDVQVKESWYWAGVGTIYCTAFSATVGDRVASAVSHAAPASLPASMPTEPTADVAPRSAPTSAPAQTVAAADAAASMGQATTKDGASLRSAPLLASAGGKISAIVPAGTSVILKRALSNSSGSWWFVSTETKGEGWIREQELDLIRH